MERPGSHSRSKSAFSIKSDKSASSKNSRPKHDLVETSEEKHRHALSATGKANPNYAMNEAQPIAAAWEAPTIGSLRSVQHVDHFGNLISEPDLSNPTRSRWERPLDTIRSFESAIDTEYQRRTSLQRPGTAMFSDSGIGYGNQSRRTSYFGMDQPGGPRYSQVGSQFGPGYYGRGRDSYARDNYMDGGGGGGGGFGYGQPSPMSPGVRMRMDRRQPSEPMPVRQNNENVYPSPGYQRSRDTVNTGYTNGSSEPWANSTDPSSENSSIDKISAVTKQQHESNEAYGHSGYGGPHQRPIMEEGPPLNEYGYKGPVQPFRNGMPTPVSPPEYSGNAAQRGRNIHSKLGPGSQGQGPPLVPEKDSNAAVRPALQSASSEKKKSWLKRTFSKSSKT